MHQFAAPLLDINQDYGRGSGVGSWICMKPGYNQTICSFKFVWRLSMMVTLEENSEEYLIWKRLLKGTIRRLMISEWGSFAGQVSWYLLIKKENSWWTKSCTPALDHLEIYHEFLGGPVHIELPDFVHQVIYTDVKEVYYAPSSFLLYLEPFGTKLPVANISGNDRPLVPNI